MRTRGEDVRNSPSAGPMVLVPSFRRLRGRVRGSGAGRATSFSHTINVPQSSPPPPRVPALGRPRTRPIRIPSGRGRARGRSRGRARGYRTASVFRDESPGDETSQRSKPIILKRRVRESSASTGSSDEADDFGEDMILIERRGSRRRTLPARFKDAPVTPIARRRTGGSGLNRSEQPVSEHVDPTVRRSALKSSQRINLRSPPSIAEKIAEEEEEDDIADVGGLMIEKVRGHGIRLRGRGGNRLQPSVQEFDERVLREEEGSRKAEKSAKVETADDLGMGMLQDVIDMDHGFRQSRPLRKRQRVISRSSIEGQEPTPPLFQSELDLGQEQDEQESENILEDDDLISMEPLEVALPVEAEPRRPCKVCHRYFKPANMKQHMLSHSALRPFKCEFCWAAFPRRSDVFRHVKILHHQEKPFKCAKDGKEFSDRNSLKAHMEMHKRPALFACKVCDFRFGKFESYVNHVKNIHPTGEPIPNFPEEVEPEPEPVAPPRGRYGPTPLQTYIDDMDHPRSGMLEGNHNELQSSGTLENIETEVIPHDSMHLLDEDVTNSSTMDHQTDLAAEHEDLADTEIAGVVSGQDVVIDTQQNVIGSEPVRHKSQDKDESQEQIDFPPLEEDAAAILGMTDLALTNENTSLQIPVLEQEVVLPDVPRPALVLSGSSANLAKRFADPLISTRNLSQPRVVTIGKPFTPTSRKTVLLTRPRMVAGKQVLQAVKVESASHVSPTASSGGQQTGHRLLASRVGGVVGPRQLLVNRPGTVTSVPPRPVSQSRVVRPAMRTVAVTGARAPLAPKPTRLRPALPTIRVVRPRPPPAAANTELQLDTAGSVGADGTGDSASKNIEVTTTTSGGGSRTIVLQTSGDGGGDVLQSEEAMHTLLEAVQQLVAASGDTLEGKQIEIVMQNDGQAEATPEAVEPIDPTHVLDG